MLWIVRWLDDISILMAECSVVLSFVRESVGRTV